MAALDQAAFATCMAPLEPFEDQPLLAVAVSGGADSLALTLLADRWAKERGGEVVGLTVDHGLRMESREEAAQTGRWLETRGIVHHILTWTGAKPRTGLQKRAREARYALLTDWCREHGYLHLLTAHHRQDQAETVALRKARRSGEAGLAAMSPVRELPGLRLLRPLLGIDKASLEQTLCLMGQPWLDDPSNADPAFTRSHLRREGLDVDALIREAEAQGQRRMEADRVAAAALVRHARIDPAGFATLDQAGFARLPHPLAADILTRLLLAIGGRVYPPRKEALARRLEAMRDGSDERAARRAGTLAHCRILPHRGRWLICRERVASEPLPLRPFRRERWDERFAVTLKRSVDDLQLRALADKARLGEKTLIAKEKSRELPGVVKRGLPSLWRGTTLVAIPHLGLYDAALAPGDVDLQFCPRTPLANAPFMPHISGRRNERSVVLSKR